MTNRELNPPGPTQPMKMDGAPEDVAITVNSSQQDVTHSLHSGGPGEKSPPSAPALEVGAMFNQYRIEAKLGQGGMGAVYKALQTRLGKHVALKVLPAHLTRDAAVVARFDREMKAVGRLEHPHIVRAMDAGDVDGMHYLVMEYVEGLDLSQLVRKKGARSVIEACELVRQAAVGLAHAHENGLIHRDIKPSNLLLSKQGKLKILDLGLARLQGSGDDEGNEATAGLTLTTQGVSMGTPDYMAPEQWGNTHAADARADIYALGCTLYYLLTGHAPYDTKKHATFVAKMKAHVIEPIPDLKAARPEVPDELNTLYRHMLAKEPAERTSSAAEVAKSLARIIRALRGGGSTVQDRPADVPTRPEPGVSVPAANDELQSALAAISIVSAPRRVADQSPHAVRKRPGCLPVALAGGLAAALLLAGIITITIRNRDGSTTRIEVPDDSSIEVTKDGKPLATIEPPATKLMGPTGKEDVPPATTPPGSARSDASLSATSPSVAATANTMPVIMPKFADDVWSIAVSPDDRWLACGDRDVGLVRVYDRRTLQTKAFLNAGTSAADMVAFSKENRLAVRCNGGQKHEAELTVWDLETQKPLPMSTPTQTAAFAWAPHAEVLAISKTPGELGLWDAQKNEWKSWSTKIKEVRQLAFSADGQFLAAQTSGNVVHLLRADTGEPLHEIQLPTEGRSGAVGSFAWSPGEPWLAIAQPTKSAERDLIRIVEFPSGKEIRSFEIEASKPAGASLLQWKQPDRIVVASGVKVLAVSSDTGHPRTVFPLEIYESIRSFASSSTGDNYSATAGSGVMQLRSDAQGKFQLNHWAMPQAFTDWQPGGDQLLLNAQRGYVWSGKVAGFHRSGQPLTHWRYDKKFAPVRDVKWLSREEVILWANGAFQLYDSAGQHKTSVQPPMGLRNPRFLDPAPDRQHIVVVQEETQGAKQKLFLFDRQLQLKAEIPLSERSHVKWTGDSQKLVVAARSGGTTFYNTSGETVETIHEPTRAPEQVAVSSTGIYAVGYADQTIQAWDGKRQPLWTYQSANRARHGEWLEVFAWSPVEEVLAVGYRTGRVELLDGHGKLVRTLAGPLSKAGRIRWSSDGKSLAVAYAWDQVCVWSSDGQLQWTGFILPDGSQASFAADGKLLHGDPKLIEENLVFLVTDDQGQQPPLSYEAFQKWREAPTAPSPSKPSVSATPDADPQRATALAVFKAGGIIDVNDYKGGQYTVTKAADLPQGAFFIRNVYFHGAAGPFGDVFARLARLPHLHGYSGDAPLTDAELAQLGGLDLQFATILRARVTDQSAAAFAQWRNAYAIDLKQMAVGNAMCRTLGQLPSLTRLNLEGSQVSDAGLAELAKCRKLSLLTLAYGKGFTSQGIASLCESPLLAYLSLIDCPVGDEIVEPLSTAQQIRLINLAGTKVSADGARRLQKALPKCCVYHPATRDDSRNHELVQWLLEQEPATLRDAVLNEAITKDQAQPLPVGSIAFPTKSPPGSEANRLAAIFGLRELEWPNLKQADAAAKHFGQLDGLRILRLRGSDLSGEGLVHLAPLTRLTRLHLSGGAKVNDAALGNLPDLPSLSALNLDSCPIRGSGLQHLARAPGLQELSLTSCWDLDSSGLKHLPPLDQLRFLRLVETKIDDEAVPHLSRYTSLRFLQVSNTNITAEGVEKLSKALPRCVVHWNDRFIGPENSAADASSAAAAGAK